MILGSFWDEKMVSEINENGDDEGRRGTPRAHTQGKRSHGLKEASQTHPAPYIHFWA